MHPASILPNVECAQRRVGPPPTRGVNRDSGTDTPTAVGSGDFVGIRSIKLLRDTVFEFKGEFAFGSII